MKKMTTLIMIALIGLGGSAMALTEGDTVPDIKVASTSGEEVSLADFKGSWLVVYFYPKSFTPGCTKEACSLRDGYAELEATGATLLGVSLDDLETQHKFRKDYQLPFNLLADTSKELSRSMGALMVGGFMTKRMTFIINPEGTIAKVLTSVTVSDHDSEVLAALKELQAKDA